MSLEGLRNLMRIGTSSARKWWLLAGAFVVFLLLFGLVERFVGPGPSSSPRSQTEAAAPAGPTVRRLEDGAIEIRSDFFRRTTIRLGDKDEEKELFDCLSRGIEGSFGNGQAEGWSGREVRSETKRIQDRCLGSVTDLPTLPRSGTDLLSPRGDSPVGRQ